MPCIKCHFRKSEVAFLAGGSTILSFFRYLTVMEKLKDILERSAFGVCSYLGHKMGIASSRVRMYFIYLSFAALGSPIIFYLFIAFWLNVRDYIRSKRNAIWE